MDYVRQAAPLIATTLGSSVLGSEIVRRVLDDRYDLDLSLYAHLGWWGGGFLAVLAAAVFSRSRPYALVAYVVGCALVAADRRNLVERAILDLMVPDGVERSFSLLTDYGPLVLACFGLALAQDDYAASLGIGRDLATGRIRARWPLALWLAVFALFAGARWRVAAYTPHPGRYSLGYLVESHVVYCGHSSECKLLKDAAFCGKCSTEAVVGDDATCKLPASASCACIGGECVRSDLKRSP